MASITYTRGRIDNVDIDPDTADYYFIPFLNFVSGWAGTVSLFHNTDGHDVNYAYKYWETVVVGTDPDGNEITTQIQKTIDPPILNSLGFNQISAPDDLKDPLTVVGPPNSPALRYIELDRQVQFLQYNYTVNRLLDPLDFFSPDGTVFDSYQAMEESIVEAYQDYLNELSQHLLGFVATVNNIKTSNSNAEIVFDGFDLSFVIADGSFNVPYLYAGGSFILYPMEASLELKNPENFLEVDELISEADEDDTVVILSGATSDFDPEVASNITKVSLAGGDDLAVVFSSKDTFEFDGGVGNDVFALKSESNGPFTITLHDNEFVYVDEITSASSATFHNENSEFSTVFDLGDNVVALNRRATYDLTGTSSRFFGSNREETIDGTDQADALLGDGHPFGDDFDETQIIENIGELGDFTQFSLNDTDQITYLLSLLNYAGSQLVAGQDRLVGDGGDDLLVASPRMRAILEAGDGNDLVIGGSNNDEIDVGKDNDKAFGGEGEDTFKAAAGSNMLFGYSPDPSSISTYAPVGPGVDGWRYDDPDNDFFEAAFGTTEDTPGSTSSFYGGESQDRHSDRDEVKFKGAPTDYVIDDPGADGDATVVSPVDENDSTLFLYDVEFARFDELPQSVVVVEPRREIDAAKLSTYAYDNAPTAEAWDWWPVHSIELGIDPYGHADGVDYSFVDGVYTGSAGVRSANAHLYFGQYESVDTLAISFRGTDAASDALDYPDFQTHYDLFAPLLRAIDEYTSQNTVAKVLVTGHSLGGAMAQMYLSEKKSDGRFEGFTYGSPGAATPFDPEFPLLNIAHTNDAVPLGPIGFQMLQGITEITDNWPEFLGKPKALSILEDLVEWIAEKTKFDEYSKAGFTYFVSKPDTGFADFIGEDSEHSKFLYEETTRELFPFYDILENEKNRKLAGPDHKPWLNIVYGSGDQNLTFDAALFEIPPFADELYLAGDGNNWITPGTGNDRVYGGAGNDTVFLSGTIGKNLIVKIQGNTVEVTQTKLWGLAQGWTKTLFDIEGLVHDGGTFNVAAAAQARLEGETASALSDTEVTRFSDGSNVLIGGSDGDDELRGGEGNDLITGNAGSDQIFGEAGNDTLIAGSGAGDDHYDGGSGTDTIVYSSTTLGVTVDLSTGAASGPEIDNDTLSGIENVTGGSGDDTLTGNEFSNELLGGEGNDSLDGRGGDDLLAGHDGNDTLTGGEGSDIFAFSKGHGHDRITDFSPINDQLYLLGDNLQLSDVNGFQDGNDLLITFNSDSGDDSIRLTGLNLANLQQVMDAITFQAISLNLLADSYSTPADQIFEVTHDIGVLANDSLDLDEVAEVTVLIAPEHGSVEIEIDGSFTFTPDPGFNGIDGFLYRVESIYGGASNQIVTIEVGNTPVTDIEMTSGGSVAENANEGTTVASFVAIGSSAANLTLVDDAGGLFVLDGSQLNVAAGAVFNFATQNSHVVTLSASGSDGTPYQESFTVFIENVGAIVGTPDPDVIGGTSSRDDIRALASDDTINGSDGSDEIDGGEGNDTVSYADARAGYTQTLLPNGTITLDKPGGETDTLVHVERIDFTDGDYVYDLISPNLGYVYRVYEAAFNRTPDEGGLRFWLGEADLYDQLGWSEFDKQHHIARIFNESLEFRLIFGEDTTNLEYVDAMYRNVLNRPPDQAGYDYWTGRMDDGLSREEILVFFAESPENRIFTDPEIDNGVWVV